jgi:hypothetical protein
MGKDNKKTPRRIGGAQLINRSCQIDIVLT